MNIEEPHTTSSAEDTFSDELECWLRSGKPKTLGALDECFEQKAVAVAIVLLMFVPALPVPTGGVTHVFEAVTVLIALQLIVGRRTIWLPERVRSRELGALTTGKAIPFVIHRIRWCERFSHPRLASLFQRRWFMRAVGLLIMAFTLGAAVAPPFSGLDTLPALGVVVIALSIILQDVVVLLVGIAIGSGGLALIATLGTAAARLVRELI